jgi:hypothetical protein
MDLPFFVYKADSSKGDEMESTPALKVVEHFISRMLQKMKLTNEVCLLALIFIERLIVSKYSMTILEKRRDLSAVL